MLEDSNAVLDSDIIPTEKDWARIQAETLIGDWHDKRRHFNLKVFGLIFNYVTGRANL